MSNHADASRDDSEAREEAPAGDDVPEDEFTLVACIQVGTKLRNSPPRDLTMWTRFTNGISFCGNME